MPYGLLSQAAARDFGGRRFEFRDGPVDAAAELSGPSSIVSGRVRTVEPALSEVLSRTAFQQQLHREMRRADRIKSPLSIALFSVGEAGGADRADFERLLHTLVASKRETDLLGYLGDYRVAILLTDTDESGARVLEEKIARRAGLGELTCDVASYPARLFETVMGEDVVRPQGEAARDLMDSATRRHRGYLGKRLLDLVGALAGIVLLSPIMLAAAAAVALTSRGPIVYKQMRIGRGGQPFSVYKFRSMYTNVDDRIHREYIDKYINGNAQETDHGGDGKPFFKMKSDPRITPVGRFIRKTSIDELPQFFNVLKGDMSLVGPRPPLPYEVEKYQPWHLRRVLEAVPGVTGLWQVDGRSTTTFDEMVRMDLRYIRDCSLGTDVNILLKTVRVVLACKDAA
jgi:lipopolysaccharide/colanic/teichoic acid biosynthesis glycosyltransferase